MNNILSTYNGDAIVHIAVGEEVSSQALLLDLSSQHGPHRVRIVEKIPHLKRRIRWIEDNPS